MKALQLFMVISMTAVLTSCASHVGKDYGTYLSNNTGSASLEKVNVGKNYYLTDKTSNHSKKITAFSAGPANSWHVKFEEIIDATLASKDYEKSFGALKKADKITKKGKQLKVDLVNYDFKDHRAYVDLKLEVLENSKVVFKKTYSAKGKSQGGKMFWAGAFGMKNAIQQSTMMAVNEIFTDFTKDISKKK